MNHLYGKIFTHIILNIITILAILAHKTFTATQQQQLAQHAKIMIVQLNTGVLIEIIHSRTPKGTILGANQK